MSIAFFFSVGHVLLRLFWLGIVGTETVLYCQLLFAIIENDYVILFAAGYNPYHDMSLLQANKDVIGSLIDRSYKSQQGHIVVRVVPGGK